MPSVLHSFHVRIGVTIPVLAFQPRVVLDEFRDQSVLVTEVIPDSCGQNTMSARHVWSILLGSLMRYRCNSLACSGM